MSSAPILHFLGGTGSVTGSRFLLELPHGRVLVDCGLFQGLKELRLRNWQEFPVPPASIDAVVLTHAHVDHSGYLPALARHGFAGPIYTTADTAALCRIILPDSGRLQEEDAEYAARKGYSKHRPPLPLYTQGDAERVLRLLRPVGFDQPVDVLAGAQAVFRPAGHILGSAIVTLALDGARPRTITFSGDLGRPQHPLLRPPAPPPASDVIVVESTYGDRRHEDEASLQLFEDTLVRTIARRGMVVIPSFAVDRTEVLLYHLRRLMRAGKVPVVPVYVDSPMALDALACYRDAIRSGRADVDPVPAGDDPFDTGNLRELRTRTQSKAIHREQGPGVIISASGMATGGRVLHHLAQRLPNPRDTVILAGYQAAGTRGRTLLDGARAVKLLGRYIAVHAEVIAVPAFSVHADQQELVDWLRAAPRPPETVFIVHGEPTASSALATAIGQQLDWTAVVPRYLEQVRLD